MKNAQYTGVRIIVFFTLLVLSTMMPLFVFVPAALMYALVWRGYELIMLGMLIDAYFGVDVVVPYYTLIAGFLVASAEWVKPSLLVYNR